MASLCPKLRSADDFEVEIDPEVDFDSRRAVYFRQMRYGLFVSITYKSGLIRQENAEPCLYRFAWRCWQASWHEGAITDGYLFRSTKNSVTLRENMHVQCKSPHGNLVSYSPHGPPELPPRVYISMVANI